MASKSKRARMEPQRNLAKFFMYWAIVVFVVKLIIIFNIQGGNIGIGDDNRVVLHRRDRGIAPSDVCHIALFPRSQSNVVTDIDLFGQNQLDAPKKVGQGTL